jgi:hypothetical protein
MIQPNMHQTGSQTQTVVVQRWLERSEQDEYNLAVSSIDQSNLLYQSAID